MKSRINWDRVVEYIGLVITTAVLLLLAVTTLVQFVYGEPVNALQWLVCLLLAMWAVDHFNGRADRRDLRSRLDHARWRAQTAEQRLVAYDAEIADLTRFARDGVQR